MKEVYWCKTYKKRHWFRYFSIQEEKKKKEIKMKTKGMFSSMLPLAIVFGIVVIIGFILVQEFDKEIRKVKVR